MSRSEGLRGRRSGWQRLLSDGVRVRVAMTWLGVLVPSVRLHSGAGVPQSLRESVERRRRRSTSRFPRRHAGCFFYIQNIDRGNRCYQAMFRCFDVSMYKSRRLIPLRFGASRSCSCSWPRAIMHVNESRFSRKSISAFAEHRSALDHAARIEVRMTRWSEISRAAEAGSLADGPNSP